MRDIKQFIGIVMRVLDGGETNQDEIVDLDFDADEELLAALNEAYIQLLEFVHDRDVRRADGALDSLNRIVKLCDSGFS